MAQHLPFKQMRFFRKLQSHLICQLASFVAVSEGLNGKVRGLYWKRTCSLFGRNKKGDSDWNPLDSAWLVGMRFLSLNAFVTAL